jgi:hypothetical protein
MLSATVMLSACSSWPLMTESTSDHLDFFARALSADPQKRESMWRDASRSSHRSQGAALDRALLQSVPGHSGYDPNAAESALQALIDDGPPAAIDSIARMRLAELKTELRGVGECRQENAQLKQRLSRVVDIERKLNSNGH